MQVQKTKNCLEMGSPLRARRNEPADKVNGWETSRVYCFHCGLVSFASCFFFFFFLVKYYSEHMRTKEMKQSCPDWRGRTGPVHTHVGSVSTRPAPGSSEQTEDQQEAQPRAGETEAQGGGGTRPESHSPEGGRQVLAGHPDPQPASVGSGPGCGIRKLHLSSGF